MTNETLSPKQYIEQAIVNVKTRNAGEPEFIHLH